jgi:hypothetical protein
LVLMLGWNDCRSRDQSANIGWEDSEVRVPDGGVEKKVD